MKYAVGENGLPGSWRTKSIDVALGLRNRQKRPKFAPDPEHSDKIRWRPNEQSLKTWLHFGIIACKPALRLKVKFTYMQLAEDGTKT